MTKISVVTPVYNGERYFDRAVPSILAQSRGDFEWVIVDDGSTDTTPERLAALAASDARVRVLSPGRLGYARALNYAIEQARGTYIANQDFDDRSYPDRLRLQAAFLDAHPEVGVVGGRYVLIDETRHERYERKPPEQHDQIVRAMASRIPFAHTLVMFRKEAWRQAGGYPLIEKLGRLPALDRVRPAWLAVRQPSRSGRRAFRPCAELFPEQSQVSDTAAEPGQAPAAGDSYLRLAAVDEHLPSRSLHLLGAAGRHEAYRTAPARRLKGTGPVECLRRPAAIALPPVIRLAGTVFIRASDELRPDR
jgi:Glycosyl transferase family 2